nr:hypothetical protein [Cellulomonas triticagri]
MSPPADPTASRPEQAGGRPAARGARSRRHPPESVAGRVLDALAARRGRDVAEVARRSGLSVREVVSALGALELAGEACRAEGGWRRP